MKRRSFLSGLLAAVLGAGAPAVVLAQTVPADPPAHFHKLAHTYSIVAVDLENGDLGVAVQSKFPNVGGLVPWAKAGVGAIATQALSNTTYAERGLEMMAAGKSAGAALKALTQGDDALPDRQVGMVDANGEAASFTGRDTFDWAGGRVGRANEPNLPGGQGELIVGRGYAVQANIMVSDRTVKNMAETFENTQGALADRLVAALHAGQAGGGDKRGMQSAALLVVRKNGGYLGGNDRFIDIRVYDAPDPLAELDRLLTLHKLYFFPSKASDLLPIGHDIVKKLEPILLAEPADQPDKWLDKPQGEANQAFLEALRNFMYWENYDVRVRMDGRIDRVVLEDIVKNHPSE